MASAWHSFFSKTLPPGERIGESWEVADLPEGTSLIGNGPLGDLSLRDAVALHPAMVLGDNSDGGPFPLVVKFIDAEEDVSVQVHPAAGPCANHRPEARGKEETWVVVDVQPRGQALAGARPGVTPDEFGREVASGSGELCEFKWNAFNRYPCIRATC